MEKAINLLAVLVITAQPAALAPSQEHPAEVVLRISRDPLCEGQINPFQYGQFIEYLCDLVPSMWAEKLYDGSFEGLSPYKGMEFIKQTDFREKPWYPSGQVNRAEYILDPAKPVCGHFAQRIQTRGTELCTVGLSQDGVSVEKQQALLLSCYLHQNGLRGPVEVILHRENKIYARCSFDVGAEWKKYHAKLIPTETDAQATFSFSFRGPATLWIDNVSLIPEATVGGWRPEVVEAIRALKPGIIRFGGSALDDGNLGDFEWRDSVGDPDQRKPFRAWGGLQPYGAGLEEIVQLIRACGAEPLICVRFRERGPKDAADEVEYFNGTADSLMGSWRVRNGHSEPYHIKYWQVGNERAGLDYEDRVAAFCQAMKKADPNIELFSSYPQPGVLRRAGRWLDYACPHHYGCADLIAMDRDLRDIQARCQRLVPQHHIKIAVTEWNTTGGDAGPTRAMLWTLANALACSRYHNLLHRHADKVEIANRSNLTNSFCSGIIQTDNHRLYKTPTYYAQQLYATLAGNRPLKIVPRQTIGAVPDISATYSTKDNAVVLFAVNPSLEPIKRSLDFGAFGNVEREIDIWTLADTQRAAEPDVTNGFAEPDRVRPVKSTILPVGSKFAYAFPELALTVMRVRVRS
jgi:alpha-L-arabinofuranosidase